MYTAPPQVAAEPNQFVLLGSDATLRCNVTGDGVNVRWRGNGEANLIDGSDERYSAPMLGLLRIPNTTMDDAGIYECRANNAHGGHSVNITLTVLSKFMDVTICFFTNAQCIYMRACVHACIRQ